MYEKCIEFHSFNSSYLGYRGGTADILQQVDLPIVDRATCERTFQNYSNPIDSTQHICAGYRDGGKDTCQGELQIGG